MRIISPIIADSEESFDETTTAPCTGADVPRTSAQVASSDLKVLDTV
jgi:hypothetical protein